MKKPFCKFVKRGHFTENFTGNDHKDKWQNVPECEVSNMIIMLSGQHKVLILLENTAFTEVLRL